MGPKDGMRRLREERRERGVCMLCGLTKPSHGKKHCEYCLRQKREYAHKRLDRIRAEAVIAQWKDAVNQPPTSEDDVFLMVGGKEPAVGYYNVTLGRWAVYSDIAGEVTHWMAMPVLDRG